MLVFICTGVTCSKSKRADPVSMSVTLSARLGIAQNAKRADPVNRSVNNLRLTLNMSGLTTLCNRLRLRQLYQKITLNIILLGLYISL